MNLYHAGKKYIYSTLIIISLYSVPVKLKCIYIFHWNNFHLTLIHEVEGFLGPYLSQNRCPQRTHLCWQWPPRSWPHYFLFHHKLVNFLSTLLMKSYLPLSSHCWHLCYCQPNRDINKLVKHWILHMKPAFKVYYQTSRCFTLT